MEMTINYPECRDCRNLHICLLIDECVGSEQLTGLEIKELAIRKHIPINQIERSTMMTTEFHKTIMGKRFYDTQFPRLVKAVEEIAQELKKKAPIEEENMEGLFVDLQEMADRIERNQYHTVGPDINRLLVDLHTDFQKIINKYK